MRIDRKKLACIMLDQDIKVGQLVERSGLARSTVSAIRGGKCCTLETVKKVAQALNCNVSEILEDK